MIERRGFTVEPWACAKPSSTWTCSRRPSRCSRCPTATSGCAATWTRASRTGCPARYLNGFYELRPLPYAEAGYGYPESGQTVINVTNGKLIRLLVDDEPFDVRYGELRSHERVLDFRAGVLRRTRRVGVPAGRAVRVTLHPAGLVHPARRSPRSPTRSSRWTAVRVVVQSELRRQRERCRRPPADPRVAAVLDKPLRAEQLRLQTTTRVDARAPTRRSGLRIGRGDGSPDRRPGRRAVDRSRASTDWRAWSRVTAAQAGADSCGSIKFVAYGWSARALAAGRP